MDIAHRRLRNLRLSAAPLGTAAEVVDWLGAVQSQDFAGALWAIGVRMDSSGEAEVLNAFNAGAILRTHVLRPTWHFVSPADIRWLLAVTAPRVHGVNGTLYRQNDLDAKLLSKCQTVIARALKGGRHLTREALGEALARAGVSDPTRLRLTYMVMAAELEGVICSGPRIGKQFTYALLDERVPAVKPLDRDTALAELARRYFASRGPASVHDFARWSGLTVADAQVGLEATRSGFAVETIDGQRLWSAPTDPTPLPSPTAFLLSVYDEYVAGYKDRSAICPPQFWKSLEGLGNALHFIIVIDGQVIGTWRRTFTREAVTIELSPLRRLAAVEKQAVQTAAERYGAFVGLTVKLG